MKRSNVKTAIEAFRACSHAERRTAWPAIRDLWWDAYQQWEAKAAKRRENTQRAKAVLEAINRQTNSG